MLSVRPKAAWMAGVLGLFVSTLGLVDGASAGGLLQPSSFASLGQLPDEAGQYSINTSGTTPVMTLPDGSTINGVIDPSGQVAVFTFNSVQLDNASITATGSRPVALLSQGDMTVNATTINLSASGSSAYGSAQNIPGAGGGVATWSLGAGTGGPGYPGGSQNSGGGGGFGGAGGAGAPGYFTMISGGPTGPILTRFNVPGGPGGGTYGGVSSPFQGGSAGGYGSSIPITAGAGGGAIELGATGNLQLQTVWIYANGGSGSFGGGGGSGGNISLLGSNISLLGAELDAQGGAGGQGFSYGGMAPGAIGNGGGGGGGIVDMAGNILFSYDHVYVNGGAGDDNGQNGLFFTSSVPEPSGIVLASIASLAGVSYGLIRRRAASRRCPRAGAVGSPGC